MGNSKEHPNFLKGLKTVLDKSLEGAVISDIHQEDQPVIYCNNAFLKMTGYEKEEVLGRNCRFLQKNDRDQEDLKILRTAIKNKEPCKVVLRNYRKSGELFYNRLSISPITNKKDEITHYLGIQDDVSDIIALDRELTKVEEERKLLISEVHHRVKNNLAVMSSLMNLEQSGKKQQNMLEKSKLRINSMAAVHEKLYQKKGLSYLNLSDFIRDLKTSELININEFDVDLEYNYKLDNVEVNINQAIPLAIIISELIENIYRHAYPGQSEGKVYIKLKENNDGSVVIEIVDFGVGLPGIVDFFAPDTIGFTIVNVLLAQVRAKAEFVKNDEIGFGIRIVFSKSDDPGSSQRFRIMSEISN